MQFAYEFLKLTHEKATLPTLAKVGDATYKAAVLTGSLLRITYDERVGYWIIEAMLQVVTYSEFEINYVTELIAFHAECVFQGIPCMLNKLWIGLSVSPIEGWWRRIENEVSEHDKIIFKNIIALLVEAI